jgi:hypothetical protein
MKVENRCKPGINGVNFGVKKHVQSEPCQSPCGDRRVTDCQNPKFKGQCRRTSQQSKSGQPAWSRGGVGRPFGAWPNWALWVALNAVFQNKAIDYPPPKFASRPARTSTPSVTEYGSGRSPIITLADQNSSDGLARLTYTARALNGHVMPAQLPDWLFHNGLANITAPARSFGSTI